ncbi:PadR family transcriptional regulator [Paenibacillus barcinonensis]|uniref:PadR family transcriptional regulator n=1 Tax=Paenibacillus barcinonensis TaxID=198119 RepID=UPI001C108BB3|nr:PadR family transcriptional regulator [Paenibacillus barcinonensis]MBU5351911.1 PadR family transcriptional regulator [Paenibacillus barcinonensis]
MDISILILSQLIQGNKHGYEIKKNINLLMNRSKPVNNNSIYPMLKQFEAREIVTKNVLTQKGKPDRFVYSITELGKTEFYKILAELSPEMVTADDEFYIRLTFLNLLRPEQQQKVLEYRKTYILDQIYRLNQIVQTIGSSIHMPYSPLLSRYTIRQMECELELLDEILDEL